MPGKKMEKEDLMGFAKLMIEARNDLGITRSRAAAEIGVSKSMILAYEQGKCAPTVATLIKICKVYKCDLGDLVEIDHPQGKISFQIRDTLTDKIIGKFGSSEEAVKNLERLRNEMEGQALP